MRIALALSAALVLLACQPKPETPEQVAARIRAQSDSARSAFEQIFSGYSRHFNAAQVDSLAAQYAPQAHVMPPNARPIDGQEAVRKMYAGFFQNGPMGQLSFHLENLTVNGPVAITRVQYIFTPPAGGAVPADTGGGIGHWHMIDGRWRLTEEAWRSDRPAAPPPAAAAGRRK